MDEVGFVEGEVFGVFRWGCLRDKDVWIWVEVRGKVGFG